MILLYLKNYYNLSFIVLILLYSLFNKLKNVKIIINQRFFFLNQLFKKKNQKFFFFVKLMLLILRRLVSI